MLKASCLSFYMLVLLLSAFVRAVLAEDTHLFGLYDFQADPGGGWQLMSASDFTTHQAALVAFYNRNQGIPPIKPFHTLNCCFAVKGGEKLTISETPYGYQFPASRDGGIRCNPSAGYREDAYKFYRVDRLSMQ